MMREMRRFVFIVCIALAAGASVAQGQKTTAAVQEAGPVWTDFASAEGEFKVSFPATPQSDKNNGVLAEGITARASFHATLGTKVFYVRYEERSNFPDIMDPHLLKDLYDKIRDNQVKAANTTLISEKEIAIGDRIGREVRLSTPGVELTNRMFLVGGRFYQVMTGVAKNIANEKSTVEEQQKFFDSFVITRAIPVAAKIPENYQGKVEKGVYRNEYFDFSIELIPSWRTLSEDETNLLTEGIKENLREKDGILARGVDRNLRQTAFLLMQRRYPYGTKLNPALQFTVETTNSPRRPLRDTALLGQKTLKAFKNEPFVVTTEITDTVLGGEKFAVYDALNGPPEHQYKQRIFMGSRKDLIFMIVMSYAEPGDLSNMEKSLATLKFGKK
jgi:hypothetical protein